jgi:hypothetical protein
VIATYNDATDRSRVTGHRGVRQLLRSAALGDRAVNRAVDELQTGHAVLLVDVAEIAPRDARARLEEMARAV